MDRLETKLTLETDNARPVSFPSLVVKPSGQRFVFYTKQFTTGRTSNSRVTASLPFTLNIEAGSGTLNGTSVLWGGTSFTATANSFMLVYVDSMGAVHAVLSWDMTIIASAVVLAYVFVGNFEITRLEEVEKIGYYIYAQKQELVGSAWQWTNQEYLVNTGEQPSAFYDQVLDKIYLQYIKDSAVYFRIFNPSDELSFRYIPNVYIQAPDTIHLSRDPQNSLNLTASSGNSSKMPISDIELFSMIGGSALSFPYNTISSLYEPHIFIPFITGSYTQYLRLPYWVEVYKLVGSNYVLEDSIEIQSNDTSMHDSRWYHWQLSFGRKYIGLKLYNTIFSSAYYTPVESRIVLDVFPPFDLYSSIDPTNICDDIIEMYFRSSCSAARNSLVDKVLEYEETKDFEQDSFNALAASGRLCLFTKVLEYDESRDFEQDSFGLLAGAGFRNTITIVNT